MKLSKNVDFNQLKHLKSCPPLHWKIPECIFEKDGFVFERQESSHRVYVKEGVARPIIIPTYKDIDRDIILGLMRTATMTREKVFEFLSKCR